MMSLFLIPRFLYALLFVFAFPRVLASPATLPFTDCFTGNISQKLSVSTVYAQVVGDNLNVVVLGQTPQEIDGFTNSSKSLGKIGSLV